MHMQKHLLLFYGKEKQKKILPFPIFKTIKDVNDRPSYGNFFLS